MTSLATERRPAPPAFSPGVVKERSNRPVPVEFAERQVNRMLRRFARNTAETRDVKFSLPGAGGPGCGVITVRHVADQGVPVVSVRTVRADLTRVSGSEREKLEQLRVMDTPDDVEVKAKQMRRDSHRLDKAVELASALKNPSFRIYTLQRNRPLGFGASGPQLSRPLKPSGLVMANQLASLGTDPSTGQPVVDQVYKRHVQEALELGSYTVHDPDTLHPRFLEYVHERTINVPERDEKAARWAARVMESIWRSKGISVKARTYIDTEPDNLAELMNPGTASEYAEHGVHSRKDPRLIETLSQDLKRMYKAGYSHAHGRPMPSWVYFSQQPVLSFGKTELKQAKVVNGKREEPVPRFIFSPSPNNYKTGAYLHSDASHKLQELDPTHGPGFGPSRGRAHKLLDKVMKHLIPGTTKLSHRAIMSDIAKWDANMPEFLLGLAFDSLESIVDKSDLDSHARAARKIMCRIARRQLMSKIVEHPSGYFVELFGCMPSGSFYTSLLNTIGNDILALSLLAKMWMDAGNDLDDLDVDEVAAVAADSLISYGDNQLIFESLFATFGLSYDVSKHAEHLAVYGMRLKIDETDVSDKLGRVRFCSRSVISTPRGLAITRSHTSIFSKIGGRPHDEPVYNKLYLRALMVDLLGTDAAMYDALARLDESIEFPLDFVVSDAKVEAIVKPFARRFFGSEDPLAISNFVEVIRGARPPSRRTILSLRLPRKDSEGRVYRYGTDLVLDSRCDAPLDEVGEWLIRKTPNEYMRFLAETDQREVLIGN
ncbi:RNA-dependent RNA-polymerase [Fusarium redolens polymycovirus 1]|uniref:RNA-dependent RNA-polymerase n=1 Tax=Fusarium redolens polymycovirus 1 TaxID=2546034 RepID=A0A513ZVD9_9VIRU|nr:RNA-dependent RNA-polymerase [Fusarium redolens polymycovirus 1]QDH44656.1 RNA-dependent RNA-polymerase [Fusarium redolens polymycovirus 1]